MKKEDMKLAIEKEIMYKKYDLIQYLESTIETMQKRLNDVKNVSIANEMIIEARYSADSIDTFSNRINAIFSDIKDLSTKLNVLKNLD